MKKLLILLGSIGSFVTPVSGVIACGENVVSSDGSEVILDTFGGYDNLTLDQNQINDIFADLKYTIPTEEQKQEKILDGDTGTGIYISSEKLGIENFYVGESLPYYYGKKLKSENSPLSLFGDAILGDLIFAKNENIFFDHFWKTWPYLDSKSNRDFKDGLILNYEPLAKFKAGITTIQDKEVKNSFSSNLHDELLYPEDKFYFNIQLQNEDGLDPMSLWIYINYDSLGNVFDNMTDSLFDMIPGYSQFGLTPKNSDPNLSAHDRILDVLKNEDIVATALANAYFGDYIANQFPDYYENYNEVKDYFKTIYNNQKILVGKAEFETDFKIYAFIPDEIRNDPNASFYVIGYQLYWNINGVEQRSSASIYSNYQ